MFESISRNRADDCETAEIRDKIAKRISKTRGQGWIVFPRKDDRWDRPFRVHGEGATGDGERCFGGAADSFGSDGALVHDDAVEFFARDNFGKLADDSARHCAEPMPGE